MMQEKILIVDKENPQYILTVQGFGYTFADVNE
jgi:hypothetical protein